MSLNVLLPGVHDAAREATIRPLWLTSWCPRLSIVALPTSLSPWFWADQRSGVRKATEEFGQEYFEPDYCSMCSEAVPEVSEYVSPPLSLALSVNQEEPGSDLHEVDVPGLHLEKTDVVVDSAGGGIVDGEDVDSQV